MKTTIVCMLIQNSFEYAKKSKYANKKKQPDKEVRYSIGAHLMVAIAIEGIVNEIGEVILGKLNWDKIERKPTLDKWQKLSGANDKIPFVRNKEPLLTVKRVTDIRNSIAHPKVIDFGNDIIVRSKNGILKKNVNPSYKINEGDKIWLGYADILNQFNYKTAFNIITKSISAIKKLRNHLSVSGLQWLETIEKDISKTKKYP